MAGQVAAFEEKLAALGQTQATYLTSELEKLQKAAGYEVTSDTSWMEVQEEPA